MKGRNGTTSFLPLKGKGGFQRDMFNKGTNEATL